MGDSVQNYHEIQEFMRDPDYRIQDHSQMFKDIEKNLQSVHQERTIIQVDFVNILRVLRNSCIECSENQNKILESKIPSFVVDFLTDAKAYWNIEDGIKTVGLQFLGNLIAGNQKGCVSLWIRTYPKFFLKYFSSIDKHHVVCSMILYNCLLEVPALNDMFSEDAGEDLVVVTCNLLGNITQPDWILFLIKNMFINAVEFLPLVLSRCSLQTQLQVLQIFCEMMTDDSNFINNNSDFVAVYLASQFTERCVSLETASKDQADLFVSILQAFCWATAKPGHWTEKFNISRAVESAVTLLRAVHMYEKGNCESELIFISHLRGTHAKRDLVRLLGNLCYNNKCVQDQIRSLDGISLILEACAIDDAHPFIQQWAVFSTRNLCKNNLANQAEVAKLERVGVADSPVLKSMGLTAYEDESGKMRVKKL